MTIHPITKASQTKRSALKAKGKAEKAKKQQAKTKAATKERGKVTKRMAQDCNARDKGICQLCLRPCTPKDPPVWDHVIPIAQGGKTCESNIATLHASCNAVKGASKANVVTILRNIGHCLK
jgi:5-methylcytosine-specific restriction endonuclease McrA